MRKRKDLVFWCFQGTHEREISCYANCE